MDDKKDAKGRSLSKEDADLWRSLTKDVERLPGQDYQEPDLNGGKKEEQASVRERAIVERKNLAPVSKGQSSELDRRTEDRLRRGQMSIEGTLDLHGLNQSEAQEALRRFILEAVSQDKRCVLVITGKGRSGPGVLRQNVPIWLNEEPLEGLVLKSYPAKPKDGGEGALYVYLRRRR